MHGLQRTHQCPCVPTQIQVAWARFPTPAVPEPPVELAVSARLAAQPLVGWAQPGPVAVSAPLEASVLRVLRVRLVVLERLVPVVQVLSGHLEGWARSVPREQLEPLVLGELVARLVRLVPLALQVR